MNEIAFFALPMHSAPEAFFEGKKIVAFALFFCGWLSSSLLSPSWPVGGNFGFHRVKDNNKQASHCTLRKGVRLSSRVFICWVFLRDVNLHALFA